MRTNRRSISPQRFVACATDREVLQLIDAANNGRRVYVSPAMVIHTMSSDVWNTHVALDSTNTWFSDAEAYLHRVLLVNLKRSTA